MERIDFVIQCLVTQSFYYYLDDMEYGGWQTGSILEADGFDSEEEAWAYAEQDKMTQITIRKRTTHVTFESI